MPIIANIRDAIVDLLNAPPAPFTPAVTASAAYEATVDLETFAGARLLVIPASMGHDLLTFDGQTNERKPTIDVVLQYHAQTLKASELDPYLALAESIADLLCGQTEPPTVADAAIVEVQWAEGTWVRDHLEKYKVLTIPLTCVIEQVG